MPSQVLTENGWPRCGPNDLDRSPIPGTDVIIPLQKGLPTVVLKAIAADINAYVESVYNSRGGTDEGGWTPTNSVATSNHLGGTAFDYNWSDHPMGPPAEQAGWSPTEIAALRDVLKFYNYKGLQIVWWAADWDSPKDSMHFQMGYNTYGNPLVQEFVDKFIRPDGFSTYRRGGGKPSMPRKSVIPDAGGTFWNDVSQYQGAVIDDSYKYRVFSFRTNSGDQEDTLAIKNAIKAKQMLETGKLDLVIPYYFFRPGQANCDLHKELLTTAGLFNHPRTVSMVDVEGDRGSVSGDNSWEINDEVSRIRGWYGNYNRVIGYLNPNADLGLWRTRSGINLVIPQYGRTPGDISSIKDSQSKTDAIAHQYTQTGQGQSPWPGNVDINWSPYSVDELLVLFGINEYESEDDPLSELTGQEQRQLFDRVNQLWGALFNPIGSQSRYRADYEGDIWTTKDLPRNMDGQRHEETVETAAIRGSIDDVNLVARNVSRGDKLALLVFNRIDDKYLTQAGLVRDDVLAQGKAAFAINPTKTVFALPPKK